MKNRTHPSIRWRFSLHARTGMNGFTLNGFTVNGFTLNG